MDIKKQQRFDRLKNIANWLDAKFEGPFGIRFGLEPIINLVPVVGEIITLGFSLFILFNSYLLGCSFIIFLRMLLNIAIEFTFELIPLFGSLFDIFWKADTKNILLLEQDLNNSKETNRKSKNIIYLVLILILFFIFGCLILSYISIKYILIYLF